MTCLPPLAAQGLAECRICGDEDAVSKLDSPCACRGGLRWVHAKCLQRWVTEKGDLRCEICRTTYAGPYTAPPPRPQPPAPPQLRMPTHTGPLSAAEATVFAEELTRRFDAHAAAERRGSACLLVGLTLLGVMLLQQAVAVSGDDEASGEFYSAMLRGLLCVAPVYCLARFVAAARMRAAAEEAAGARAMALAVRLSENPSAASVPLNHPLLAFALPRHMQQQPTGMDVPTLHRHGVISVMRDADAEHDAAARRTEAAVIAYLDAAAAQQQQARAAARQTQQQPARADEFV